MNWIKSLYESLFNAPGGFAGRKVTAAVLVVAVLIGDGIYFSKDTPVFISIFIDWLIIHLCAVAFFLGLITVANLIELRTGNIIKTQTTKETTTTTEQK